MPLTSGPDLLVAVVTHTLPDTLEPVLRALCADGEDPARIVLFHTGAPSPAATRAVADLQAAWGVQAVCTPRAMRIGEARQFLVDQQRARGFIAFLDDDCVPLPGWTEAALAACAEAERTALVYGPRYPVLGAGVGSLIRAMETRDSRKLALAAAAPQAATTSPRALCAGGNTIVNIAAARELGLTEEMFARSAFEDVDFQLRATRRGWLVQFRADLAVDHHDQLGLRALFRKSLQSGRGMAQCARRHGAEFWAHCRWRPWRTLVAWFAVLAALAAGAVLNPWLATAAALPVVLSSAAHHRALHGALFAHRLTFLLIKPVRDLTIALGFLARYATLGTDRGTAPAPRTPAAAPQTTAPAQAPSSADRAARAGTTTGRPGDAAGRPVAPALRAERVAGL
ncbi:glycosyltransferase family 2 protein [Kitasatospora sp. NPDC059648]|uniref:glycosyltransferase family 2 protein n=1 Tax=Kitasatospora sp. NPDC059648 TaxID=3346894 RepID=UPI00367A1D3B